MTIDEYITQKMAECVRFHPEDEGTRIGLPYPYTVPCASGLFQELYYWDTYFINTGLLLCGDTVQAQNNIDNMRYLIDRFGFMPNGSRLCFLYNSQPPFLALMMRELYAQTGDKAWLSGAYESLKKEQRFWQENRMFSCGLSHYDWVKEPPAETVQEIAAVVTRRIGDRNKMTDVEIARGGYASCESGWDYNPRLTCEGQHFAAVDLNSLLYAQEDTLAFFAGELGLCGEQTAWLSLRDARAEKMRALLKAENGVFYDRDIRSGQLKKLASAAAFYPLYVGMATPAEAAAARGMLAKLEAPHGILTCEEYGEPGLYQWGCPNGWPPLQRIVVEGLLRYGYQEDALRIAGKYVNTVERCFEETGNLWEKYNVIEGSVRVAAEYETPAMLGWTSAVYLGFCRLLGR